MEKVRSKLKVSNLAKKAYFRQESYFQKFSPVRVCFCKLHQTDFVFFVQCEVLSAVL